MSIYMQKINFIIHFFLKILQFKESWNLIGWQHFGSYLEIQYFTRYDDEISIAMLVFILEHDKIFKKFKKHYFGAILGPFCLNISKNEFSWKKEFCQFLNISIVYHCVKNRKN